MKIGIVTYHRTLNYGACLQAVATRIVLERMGHDVYYVDYWPKYHKSKYDIFSWNKFCHMSICAKCNYLINIFLHYSSKRQRIEKFAFFFERYLQPYCQALTKEYDVVIYGSDQIWRKQKEIQSYNPFYFGKNAIKTKKHVAYAASMGILPTTEKDKHTIKELVTNLDSISVREDDLKNLLEELGFKNVFHVLDPTLLLDLKDWNTLIPQTNLVKEKYLLVYLLGTNDFDFNYIRKFSNSRCLKTIFLRGYANTKETDTNIVSAGPLEFLNLIKNAEFVLCSSFHGLAFSLIFQKQFYVSLERNEGRVRSLLNKLGIGNRLLPPKSPIPETINDIDYTIVTSKLSYEKHKSIQFITNSLAL